jgi:hypothetical protein
MMMRIIICSVIDLLFRKSEFGVRRRHLCVPVHPGRFLPVGGKSWKLIAGFGEMKENGHFVCPPTVKDPSQEKGISTMT